MKKIFLGLLIMAISTSLFAVETKYDSFGFHLSAPLIFETAEESGIKSESNMTSIAFGIHALSLYTERIGLYVNMDIIFPQKINSKITYWGVSYTFDLSRSDYDSLWGMSALFAPAICITQSESMLFTVSPGLHYTMLFADAATTSVSYLLGVGVNVQDSIFFSSNGYFSVGADIAYDFVGSSIVNGESKSGNTNDFIFTPRIGVGFKFK